MRVCRECSREFVPTSRHALCPSCRYHRRKKPCTDCGVLVSGKDTRCTPCMGKAQAGERNPNWKGGSTYRKKGYIMRYIPGHPRGGARGHVFEHILVMEEVLGRYLYPNERVHHRNGVRDDNRPENLELWAKPHPSGARVEDLVIWAKEILRRYDGVE